MSGLEFGGQLDGVEFVLEILSAEAVLGVNLEGRWFGGGHIAQVGEEVGTGSFFEFCKEGVKELKGGLFDGGWALVFEGLHHVLGAKEGRLADIGIGGRWCGKVTKGGNGLLGSGLCLL